MTPERIRQITAEKIMGWRMWVKYPSHPKFPPYVILQQDGCNPWYDREEESSQYEPYDPNHAAVLDYSTIAWKPDLDRNQSRMVVEKAREILGTGDKLISAFCDCIPPNTLVWAWIECTPLQECEVCLRALGLWER